MSLTARQFAEGLVSRMETSGMGIVVYVDHGKVSSAQMGTSQWLRVISEPRFLIIGHYDPECLCRHLVDDLKEFFD